MTDIGMGFDQPLNIDVSAIDRNLQTISHAEATWSLPSLPDAVKLDLISAPEFASVDIGGFLDGLAADATFRPVPEMLANVTLPTSILDRAAANPALAFESPLPDGFRSLTSEPITNAIEDAQGGWTTPTVIQDPDSIANRVRGQFNDVAQPGQRSKYGPQALSRDAVTELQLRAEEMGLIKEGQANGRWTPQMNSVRNEIMTTDAYDEMSGDRGSAMSIWNVVDVMDKWTSPTGLLSAAMALQFIPDTDKIAAEFDTWGDRFNDWKEDPFDARKAIDMLGPIDDIALPVINTMMLFSGVGAVAVFASKGALAYKAGTTLGRLTQVGSVAGRTEQLARGGMIAGKLAGKSGTLGTLGQGMAKWRSFTAVQVAKRGTQEAMKLGLASNLEAKIFNTGRDDDAYTEYLEFRSKNPVMQALTGAVELGLQPQGIFAPGRISGLYRNAKTVVTDPVASMLEVSQSAEIQEAVLPGVLHAIGASNPERANAIAKVAEQDRIRALGMALEIVTEDSPLDETARAMIGDRMRRISFAAAIDKSANAAIPAGVDGVDRRYAYHMLRNKLIQQVRGAPEVPASLAETGVLDLADDEHVEWIHRTVGMVTGVDDDGFKPAAIGVGFEDIDAQELSFVPRSAPKRRKELQTKLYDELFADTPVQLDLEGGADTTALDLKSERVKDLLAKNAHHNLQRKASWDSILDGVTKEDIGAYIGRFPDTVANLGQDEAFVGAMDILEDWAYGQNQLTLARRSVEEVVKDKAWVPNALSEEIRAAEMGTPNLMAKHRMFRFFDQDIEMASTRVGVQALNKPSKQQATATLAYSNYLRAQRRFIERVSADPEELFEVWGRRIVAQKGFNTRQFGAKTYAKLYDKFNTAMASSEGFGTELTEIMPLGHKDFERYGRMLQWVKQNGGDTGDALGFIDGRLDEVMNNADFLDGLGISNIGIDNIDEWEKAVAENLPFLAAEIADVDPDVAAKLASSGYRPVLMFERVSPRDLDSITFDPLTDVAAWKRNMKTLGVFSKPGAALEESLIRDRQFRQFLPQQFERVGGRKLNANDVDFIWNALTDHKRLMWDRQQVLDAASTGKMQKVMQRATGAYVPRNVTDFTLDDVTEALRGYDFTGNELEALTGVLQRSARTNFEQRGLAHMEDVAVSSPVMRSVLSGLAGSAVKNDFEYANRARLAIKGGDYIEYEGLRQFTGAKKALAAGVYGWLGANQAMNEEADGSWVATAALGGAALGVGMGRNAFTPRAVASVVAASNLEDVTDNTEGRIAAALAGGLGVYFGGAKLAAQGVGLLDQKGWSQYSKLGAGYQKMRDTARFSLSPVFDLQRYTEGAMLGFVKEGDTLDTKSLLNPLKYASETMDLGTPQVLRETYREALSTVYGGGIAELGEILEETGGSYFIERGLMGFSSLDHEAGIFHQLVAKGVDATDAAKRTREVFTYGLNGRSGLEQSVNFVFFPFSFTKKFVTEVGEFLADDMARVAVLHNSLKMYEVLNEEYELNKIWEERVPLLRQMRDFNPVAYGLSPGQFGGINRPLIELGANSQVSRFVADPVMNAFLPQSLQLGAPGSGDPDENWFMTEAEQVKDFANLQFAIMRDANQLWADAMEQGHVLSSADHVTSRAEINRGWQAFRDLKDERAASWAAGGFEWDSVMSARDPSNPLFTLKQEYRLHERQLQQRYPTWAQSYADARNNNISRSSELRLRLDAPTTSGERQLVQFNAQITEVGQLFSQAYGTSATDYGEWPPNTQRIIRDEAIKMARANPEFLRLYRMYYEDDFGPITQEV